MTADALGKLRAAYPSLPNSYFDLLSRTKGIDVEGHLGIEPGWVVVWSAESAMETSSAYGIPEYLPGYFAFGSNGGGELFVFPITGSSGECPVLMVPAVGMAVEELWPVARSFADFEAQIGKVLDESA